MGCRCCPSIWMSLGNGCRWFARIRMLGFTAFVLTFVYAIIVSAKYPYWPVCVKYHVQDADSKVAFVRAPDQVGYRNWVLSCTARLRLKYKWGGWQGKEGMGPLGADEACASRAGIRFGYNL